LLLVVVVALLDMQELVVVVEVLEDLEQPQALQLLLELL
jgi:hypothetical protein